MREIFKHVLCFFYDGTSRHMAYFDELRADAGYAGVIESCAEEMVSSHQVKRFFTAFSWMCGRVFRGILKQMFVWRLRIEKPDLIELSIDTMVMDNDEAEKREGGEPTYKGEEGFQPLQIIWKTKIVDAIFRGGKKHGNHGTTVARMVTELGRVIREYGEERYARRVARGDRGFLFPLRFLWN